MQLAAPANSLYHGVQAQPGSENACSLHPQQLPYAKCRCKPAGRRLVSCTRKSFLSPNAGAARKGECLLPAPAAPPFRQMQVQAGRKEVCSLHLQQLLFTECRCKPAGRRLVHCTCRSSLSSNAGATRQIRCLFPARAASSFTFFF